MIYLIMTYVLTAIVILLAIAVTVLSVKLNKLSPERKNKILIKDGVRYSSNDKVYSTSGDVTVNLAEGDAILAVGITYIAKKKGKILPGQYKILSTDANVSRFNLRKGGLVREYEHASDIVLNEGEEICAVSHSVILR